MPRSPVRSVEQEAVTVGFGKHSAGCSRYALQPIITQLTRSSLHRCLERHGSVVCRKCLAELRTADAKLYLFVAIDRTSQFMVVEKADRPAAAAFLEALVEAFTRYPIWDSGTFTGRRDFLDPKAYDRFDRR